MRKFPALPAVFLPAALFLAMTAAHAGQADKDEARATDVAGRAAMTDAEADVDIDASADARDKAPSGFGQVMSVLTGLLQDAAQQEASGRSDGFALDNPAIEISVTPVEGRTSLLQAPPERNAAREQGSGRERLAGGTPR